jgi:hypothetical protein
MRVIIVSLIILTFGIHFLSSCTSSNQGVSHFSKIKYLKKYKGSNRIENDAINNYTAKQNGESEILYAAKEIKLEQFILIEIEENDCSELVLFQYNKDIAESINDKNSISKEIHQPIIKGIECLDVLSIDDEAAKKRSGWSNLATTLGVLLVTCLVFILLAFFVISENGAFD